MRNNPQTPRASRPVHRLAPTQEHGLDHGAVTGTCANHTRQAGTKISITDGGAGADERSSQTNKMAMPALLLRFLVLFAAQIAAAAHATAQAPGSLPATPKCSPADSTDSRHARAATIS